MLVFALRFDQRNDLEETLDICRTALHQQHLIQIDYQAVDKQDTKRTIRPLGLFFWGNVWTLLAWCELRQDFRSFRLDRIQQLSVLKDTFEDMPGQRLSDFEERMKNCYQ